MSKIRCGFCKDYFDKDGPTVIRVGPQSFCCTEHRTAAANKHQKPTIKTKVRKKKDDVPAEVKRAVRASDGNRCRYCGRRYALHVHHIVYRSSGGTHDPSNLITLCKRHHDEVHSNKKLYQPLLREVVAIREVTGNKQILVVQLMKTTARDHDEGASI